MSYYFENPELESRLNTLSYDELIEILNQSDTDGITEEQFRFDYDYRELVNDILVAVADGKADINLIP